MVSNVFSFQVASPLSTKPRTSAVAKTTLSRSGQTCWRKAFHHFSLTYSVFILCERRTLNSAFLVLLQRLLSNEDEKSKEIIQEVCFMVGHTHTRILKIGIFYKKRSCSRRLCRKSCRDIPTWSSFALPPPSARRSRTRVRPSSSSSLNSAKVNSWRRHVFSAESWLCGWVDGDERLSCPSVASLNLHPLPVCSLGRFTTVFISWLNWLVTPSMYCGTHIVLLLMCGPWPPGGTITYIHKEDGHNSLLRWSHVKGLIDTWIFFRLIFSGVKFW